MRCIGVCDIAFVFVIPDVVVPIVHLPESHTRDTVGVNVQIERSVGTPLPQEVNDQFALQLGRFIMMMTNHNQNASAPQFPTRRVEIKITLHYLTDASIKS